MGVVPVDMLIAATVVGLTEVWVPSFAVSGVWVAAEVVPVAVAMWMAWKALVEDSRSLVQQVSTMSSS